MKFLIVLLLFVHLSTKVYAICKLEHTDDEEVKKHETQLLQKIKPLYGKQFHVKDDHYEYNVSICEKVKGRKDNAGAIQARNSEIKILGTIDHADIMGGTNWILLTYLNGTQYTSHCNYTERKIQIMIICDPLEDQGEFRLLEEKRKNVSSHCSYWFELGSSIACDITPNSVPSRGLSSGGVFCIIFFTFVGAYLFLGFLYKRLVVGSKGLEQIPNYAFWRSFGNLQADACDYICRCGPRQESQAYRGIDDRLKSEEHDDQLLNM